MRGPKVGTGTSSGQGGRGCGRLGAIHPGYGAAPARGKPTLLSRTGRGHDRGDNFCASAPKLSIHFATPARDTIRWYPATLNGAPRSDTKM
jgi:hypothetical protein